MRARARRGENHGTFFGLLIITLLRNSRGGDNPVDKIGALVHLGGFGQFFWVVLQ